jgi:hypothetical protein
MKATKKTNCDCGGKHTHKHRFVHFKTKMHQAYMLYYDSQLNTPINMFPI